MMEYDKYVPQCGASGALNGRMEQAEVAQAVEKRREVGGVERELAALGVATSRMAEEVQRLIVRLGPITISEPSAATGAESRSPEKSVCDLASGLRGQRQMVEGLAYTLREVSRRIDL